MTSADGFVCATSYQDWSADFAADADAPNSHIDDVDDDGAEGDWLTEPSPLESSLARNDLKMLHESIKINKVHNSVSLSQQYTLVFSSL